MQIILPVSFFTMLLSWSGWLDRLDPFLAPVMGFFHLPSHAALPLLIALVSSIYGGIAAMAVLPFSEGQMIVISVFILMAHGLIQETIIQALSGIHPAKAVLFRLATGSATALAVSRCLDMGPVLSAANPTAAKAQPPLANALGDWIIATGGLAAKILVIILVLLTFLEVLKALGWMQPLVRFCSPALRLMGLRDEVGALWMTAVVFGLGYSGAVIVEEVKEGRIRPADLELLHLSIGIHHSLVEDPPLFMSLGVPAAWLYLPRFVVAVLCVQAVRLWQRLGRRPPLQGGA